MKQLFIVVFFLQNIFFATAQTVYHTSFDTTSDTLGWRQFRQGYQGLYDWGYGAGHSAPRGISHDYPVGSASTDTTVDWVVSPKLDFSNGGSLDSIKIRIFSITGQVTSIDYLGAYLLVNSNDPSLASSVIEIGNFTPLIHNNGNWSDTGKFNIPTASSNCYIGIKYRATNNWFVVSVDDIYITQKKSTGIVETNINNKVQIFPNPVSDKLIISNPSDIKISKIAVVDLLGKKYFSIENNKSETENEIDITSLPSQIYLLKCIDENGVQYVSKFIKE